MTGFTVVGAKSATRPKVEITGEAFSELGGQKGGLYACQARLEITARHLSEGAVLAVDRQRGAAIDLGEHISANGALQNATRALAARLVKSTLPSRARIRLWFSLSTSACVPMSKSAFLAGKIRSDPFRPLPL